MTRLQPELVWQDDGFHRGLEVTLDPAAGRIVSVEPMDAVRRPGAARSGGDVTSDGDIVPLPGRALLPGFVNGHSHAFQRLARGRTQYRRSGAGSGDFWSWREAMYGIALSLSAEEVEDVSAFCFLEMMRTGITAVGEFHYLHHQPAGDPYPDPVELGRRVLAAARRVGMRITLLDVCYAAGGIGRPLEPHQRRFRAASLDRYLERVGRLAEVVDEGGGLGVAPGGSAAAADGSRDAPFSLATVGVAPHSIRAVPRDWLRAIADWAGDRNAPIHMHVSEQPAEVEASQAAYGLRPVELLARDGLLGPRFTAVHATHLTDSEVRLLGSSGATVCACPTTERDLGDGFLRGLDLLDAGASISLGTDSHTNLDMLEEMRLVEYHERLRRLRRVVITRSGPGDRLHVGPALLEMATRAGARSLGLDAGTIAVGGLADLVAVDLEHPSLAGWAPETLADLLTLSATPDVVRDVWVGGRRRLEDRRHPAESELAERFAAAAGRR